MNSNVSISEMEKAPLTQCPSTCSNSVSNLEELTENRRSILKGLWQGRSETWWKWFCVSLAHLYFRVYSIDYLPRLYSTLQENFLAPKPDCILLPSPANGSQPTSQIPHSRNRPPDSVCHWPLDVSDLQFRDHRGRAKFEARYLNL